MAYEVYVRKKFKYVRVYTVLRKYGTQTNFVSRAIQSLVDKYILKKKME